MSGTNPFDSDEEPSASNDEILEGFLCPMCRADLKSIDYLTEHFARQHAEEEDALKSVFKDIFSKAKKKILNNFEDERERVAPASAAASSPAASASNASAARTSNAKSRHNIYSQLTKQSVGAERGHLEYFQSVRNPRLERYASETNKLIIRLHRLLKDLPTDAVQRKQHEQQTVPWLDGSSVKLCPSCAKSFHIARRQHHCRLCGGIMCNDCSRFLQLENAMQLASLSSTRSDPLQQLQHHEDRAIRLCQHCLWLLDTRQDMLESRTCRPLLAKVYDEIRQLQKQVAPDLEMYAKIINSLLDGESIFTLADAGALRGKIGQVAETIDLRSKRILTIHSEPGSREEALKKAIRLSCVQMIKERMLSLPPLPDEALIKQIQERKRMETEQRILTEQRMAMEAYERYGATTQVGVSMENRNFAQGSDLQSLNNWSAPQASTTKSSVDDPLIEQINIIKGYIKQARQDMNFDVVETLELNLRELQREVYERQRQTSNSSKATSPQANS
ncbi:rabenosyn-5 [Drosophila sulfurigaster albostrigata]|uniref:rabenosyn-5 n=1 Tax=Drosophila sulfurigaster albostrigata TaxID=89887 RepID=UPI002D21DC7F|nr:rabenosyn-5 [Drosophila sulfurigaster albostrigata]